MLFFRVKLFLRTKSEKNTDFQNLFFFYFVWIFSISEKKPSALKKQNFNIWLQKI